MQIKISARHGQLSDATQEFIREKAEKLLRFFERLTLIEVTVDLKNEMPAVEMLVSAEHKHDGTSVAPLQGKGSGSPADSPYW